MESVSMTMRPESVVTRSESMTIKPESLFLNVDGVQKEMFSMELQRCFITEKGVEMQIVKVSNVLSFKCVCLQCGRNFLTRELLQLHMETHLQVAEKGPHLSCPSASSSDDGKPANIVDFTYQRRTGTCMTKAREVVNEKSSSEVIADLDQERLSGIDKVAMTSNTDCSEDVDFEQNNDDDGDSSLNDSTGSDFKGDGYGNIVADDQNQGPNQVGDKGPCLGSRIDHASKSDGRENVHTPNIGGKYDTFPEMLKAERNLAQNDTSSVPGPVSGVNQSSKSLFMTSPVKGVVNIMPNKRESMSLARMNLLIQEQERLLETDSVSLECKICGEVVAGGRHKFIDHVNHHTIEKPRRKFTKKSRLNELSKRHRQNGGDLHVCKVCGKDFKKAAVLREHAISHEERRHSCTTCGKLFHRKWKLAEHARTHTGVKPYLCSKCGKGFTSRYSIRCHVLLHTGEKPFKCDTCGKSCTNSSNLKSHIKVHTGEKSHLCTVCGKAFSQSSSFNAHMAIHQNVIFKCSFCDKVFKYGNSLKQHLEINHGDNSVTCEICSKVFRHHRYLRSHLRLHSKLYTCLTCDKIFSSNQNLQNHLKKHNKEKPFQCSNCGLVFSSPNLLSTHSKEHQIGTQHQETQQSQ